MKKLLSLLLCLALMLSLAATAFAAEDNTVTGEFRYGASAGFLGDSDPVRTFCYSDDYFRHTGYQYDHELAKMTMDLAGSADASTNDGWAESNRNFIDLISQCGFENIDANCYITNGPTPDSIGVNMASKQLDDYTLLAVALRGHNYKCEWASNFTVGRTGDHQGFSEARDQVLDYIKEYIAAYEITGRIKVWLTGYSRSAITANLVGGAIDQGFDFGENVLFDTNDLYCYTFEAPQGTANEGCRDALYDNIHNIINPNDLVPLVSLSAWGHSRYGIDYRLPCRQLDGSYYYRLKRSADQIFKNTEYMTLGYVTLDLIDDFHYLSLEPMTALRKQNITQIEFYQEVTALLIKVIAHDRDYYVDYTQSDLREFGATVMGGLDMPAVLKLFAQKFVSLDNLTELYGSLVRGNRKAYEKAVTLVADLFMEAMAEAGNSTYNSRQASTLVYNMATNFIKLFKTSPDTVLTLLGNILQILNAHFPEIGRVWLDITPADFFLAQGRSDYYKTHTHEADPGKYHPEEPATCTEEGTKEYYECTDADCKVLLDADGNELSDIVIPIDPNAHSFFTDWSYDESGHWHDSNCSHELKAGFGTHSSNDGDLFCDECGYPLGEAEDDHEDGDDSGGEEPYSVELYVEAEAVRSLILSLPVSCTYTLTPEISGAELEKLQFSLDGGWEWFYGTEFTIPNFFYTFKVRILDSTGTWTYFLVKNGSDVVRK